LAQVGRDPGDGLGGYAPPWPPRAAEQPLISVASGCPMPRRPPFRTLVTNHLHRLDLNVS